MKLTTEQLVVLRHTDGTALVTAGAGCGKTTVLIEYILQILLGHPCENILALTFSNAACEELITRLCQRSQVNDLSEYKHLTIMTYDAFGCSLARQHYKKFGYQNPPKPIEDKELIKGCVAEVVTLHLKTSKNSSKRELNHAKKSLIKELTREMMVHNKLIASGQATSKFQRKNPLVKEVLERYKTSKKNQNLVDFDDMVGLLIKNDMDVLKEAAQDYGYLLVDELQDTSVKQTKMLIALAKAIQTTVMVGDPKQNINTFRGAFAKNWDTIKSELKPREYSLTKSQRIPRPSLSFVNAIGGEIYPGAPLVSDVKGQSVRLIYCQTVAEQARFIADKINKLIAKGVKPEEIACLGRTRRNLSDLTVALEGHGIIAQELYRTPYTMHVNGLRNLLRLARSLQDVISERGFEFPKKRLKAFTVMLKRLGVNDQEIEQIFKKIPRLGWKAVGVRSTIKNKIKDKANPKYRPILDFRKLIAKAAKIEEPEKAISYLMDALRKVLGKDNDKRTLGFLMRDLSQLKIKIRRFSSWEDLKIKELHLNEDPEGVQLSTINGAKGKEWSYVFVLHCVEGLIPIHYAKTTQESDSEKMLLYVAITRHKKRLYLMDSPGSLVFYNGGKNKKGRKDVCFSKSSSFIKPHKSHLKVLNAV
ncbi:MAG: ATP-dependent helicase [Methylococcales bacterium]|nr:ATP-dependent helicase [Methylococcales bacterium]